MDAKKCKQYPIADLEAYFRDLRFDPAHHLGMGDIRMTIGQQEEVLKMVRIALQDTQMALHEIAEEWAGAECGTPVYAQEAYAIALAQQMYRIAADALATKPARS